MTKVDQLCDQNGHSEYKKSATKGWVLWHRFALLPKGLHRLLTWCCAFDGDLVPLSPLIFKMWQTGCLLSTAQHRNDNMVLDEQLNKNVWNMHWEAHGESFLDFGQIEVPSTRAWWGYPHAPIKDAGSVMAIFFANTNLCFLPNIDIPPPPSGPRSYNGRRVC